MAENKCYWTVDSEFGQYGHIRYMKSCDHQIEIVGDPGETVEESGYKFCPKCGKELVPVFNAEKYLDSLRTLYNEKESPSTREGFQRFLARTIFDMQNKLNERRGHFTL
jgi:hypothetical protein